MDTGALRLLWDTVGVLTLLLLISLVVVGGVAGLVQRHYDRRRRRREAAARRRARAVERWRQRQEMPRPVRAVRMSHDDER